MSEKQFYFIVGVLWMIAAGVHKGTVVWGMVSASLVCTLLGSILSIAEAVRSLKSRNPNVSGLARPDERIK